METKNVEKSDNESLNTSASILDFKSPTIKAVEEKQLFNFKSAKYKKNKQKQSKIDVKINSIGNEPSTSNQTKENISEDARIQIESNILHEQENKSKNLANDTKVAYMCPLCFKNYRDSNSRILHMKSCATKNKVSMKKLLQAVKLQERQAAERISLGLPGAPILRDKKQTSIRKMSMNDEDSQLQLALALSKSLYEIEETKNNSDTEQNFIIANTRTSGENITGRLQKRKKHKFISILQIRSQEERDRLLTEKIAEILIDNETLTQRQQQLFNENENKKRDNLRSYTLKKLLNFDNKLWNTAMLQSNQADFYVTALSPYIVPSEQKPAFMENINEVNINESHQEDPLEIKHDLCPHEKDNSSTSQKTNVKVSLDAKKENFECFSVNTLIVDWRNALNNSSSSDVVIFVNGDRHIWVHKLVFYVRCPNILLDIIPNENKVYSVGERICWTDIEYYIALAFLEFIYCGIIEKYSISSNNTVAISSLGNLARRYRVKELFRYLRHEYVNISDEISEYQKFETDKQNMQEICYSNDKKNELILTQVNDDNAVKCSNQYTLDVTTMEVSSDMLLKTNISLEKCTTPDSPIDRQECMSPDIFDDIDNIKLNQTDNTKFKNMENSQNYIEYDPLSPNQHGTENITENAQLYSSLSNSSGSSTDECMLNKSVLTTLKDNQIKQISNTMTDKVKQKSDLTLFIEEVQRENAKSDFEVCSEENSPSTSFIQHDKNPFKKAEYDESGTVSKKLYSSKFSQIKTRRKVGRLSKLENDMQIHAIENPQLYNISINDDFNLSTPPNHNYTKMSSPIREVDVSATCNDKNSEKIIQSVKKNDTSIITPQCSSSEIDTDDADISMYTKYKRKHIDNSIAVYRSALKKHKKHRRNDHINMLKQSNTNTDKSMSIIQTEKNTSNLCSSQITINEMEICNTLMNNISESTESFKQQKTSNWSNEELIATCDNRVKTQITNNESSNDEFSNILNLHSPELSDIEMRYNSPLNSAINSSIILVSSSPEIDINGIDDDYCSKHDCQSIGYSKTKLFDNDVPQYCFNETSFANVNTENRIESITSGKSTQPISTKNKRTRKRSKSEGSLQLNCNIEKDYQVCEFNNTLLRHYNKQDNYKLIMKNKFLTITEIDDIPPPNYNVMDTPELHKEMKKYGLKIQNRKKAIKLLTYIYDEMHPTINAYETLGTSTENIYNEDEEPQRKKQKINTNLLNKYNNIEYECMNESFLKTSDSKDDFATTEIIPEANVNVENVISLNDCININEAFSKLIQSNKDLYNKILQYKPLNIESIHYMLKAGGFKCKVNTLMDFLDEQCITFNLPESKTKSRTRKAHD